LDHPAIPVRVLEEEDPDQVEALTLVGGPIVPGVIDRNVAYIRASTFELFSRRGHI
jgi:hypothetical protein